MANAHAEQYTVRPATDEDDGDIRALLRRNPMPGDLSLTLEREPRYSYGAAVEGDVHQTVIAHRGTQAVGIGSRSTRLAYINGSVHKLGYLSQLRIDATARGKHIAPKGYAQIAAWHREDDCPFYVTTVIAKNPIARKVLEAEWEPKPTYKPYGKSSALLLPVRRQRKMRTLSGTTIRQATSDDLAEIASCLQRNYAAFQFAPYWTEETLADPEKTRGLEPGDFTIAIQGNKLVGCLATWDQKSFKQTVVRGYGGRWRYLRGLYNLAAPIIGTPHLPPAGSDVPHAYLSHVAVDNSDQDVFKALLTAACNRASRKDYLYVAIGLAEGNPFLEVTKREYRHVEYESIVYLVYFKENESDAEKIEKRTLHLELAIL